MPRRIVMATWKRMHCRDRRVSASAESNHRVADARPQKDAFDHDLSRDHRDKPGDGCTMAALCADAARQSEPVKAAFAAGIERQLEAPARAGGELTEGSGDNARARRIALMAQAIGAVVLSRSCPDDSPLADEILDVCRADILARL